MVAISSVVERAHAFKSRCLDTRKTILVAFHKNHSLNLLKVFNICLEMPNGFKVCFGFVVGNFYCCEFS